jgi:peroxiredoxin Q/BCP
MKLRRTLLALVPAALLFAGAVIVAAEDAPQPPAVKTMAPDFTLKSYFYPKDMTPGCTIEAHNFQRDQAMYDKMNAAIVGVSVDPVDSHVEFCTKENLTFKLLSDVDKEVVTKYGSVQKFGANTVAARNTFIVDPKGMIVKEYTKVDPNPHSAAVLADLHELQK